MKKENMKS